MQRTVLNVVVASPSDVLAERKIIEEVAEELNNGIAADRAIYIDVVRWETDSYPGFHVEGPQGLIDSILKIDACALLIGIFWKRFGTPTLDANSGTEHEFRCAYESWKKKGSPQIMVYFNQKPYMPQTKQETNQQGQVLEFKQAFPKEGLWWPYNGKTQFEKLVRNHLTQFIRGITVDVVPPSTQAAKEGPPDCPYRGLFAFREQDVPYFFGRESITERLIKKIDHIPMVGIVGASGSGKSSLVFAGLLPSLRKNNDWLIAHFRPGSRPIDSLAIALMPLLEPEMTETSLSKATAELADALKHAGGFYIVIQQLIRKYEGRKQLLLFADQFEELYTHCPDVTTRKSFIDSLLELVQAFSFSQSPFKLVLTLRGDFYGQVIAYRPFSEALQDNIIHLPPMSRDELSRAIANPAAKCGVTFESGLIEQILNDVGDEPGNLPLLEFSLMLLWNLRKNDILLLADYDSMGRLSGAIASQAEAVFQQLTTEQQVTARHVLTRLVRVSRPEEEGKDARRRAPLSEFSGDPNAMRVVRALTDARLLVMDQDNSTSNQTVEVAHEAVIRSWSRLRGWLVEDREFLLWQQRLRTIFCEWKQSNSEEGLLLRGRLLAEATNWLSNKGSNELAGDLKDFIDQSLALQDKESGIRALARVDFLLSAKPEEVTNIIDSFKDYWRWVAPRLRQLLEDASEEPEEWRIRAALLPIDESQINPLSNQLLKIPPQELLIVRDLLFPYREKLLQGQWTLVMDRTANADERLRTASALALYDPSSHHWPSITEDIAGMLVKENPLFLRDWVQALRPVRDVLVDSLMRLVRNEENGETAQEAATAVLADFAADQPELLSLVTSESPTRSYESLYRTLTRREVDQSLTKAALERLIQPEPPADLIEADRVQFGRRRAVAALTLARMGNINSIHPVFNVAGGDPESLTQFVHQSKVRGLKSDVLIEQLKQTEEERARFALMLALGEFGWDEVAKPYNDFVEQLGEWYGQDPSAAIHGASGWLLRTWGFEETVKNVDLSPLPYDPDGKREWFVLQVGNHWMTFVVYPRGEFMMGSPPWEKERSEHETPLHSVNVSRSFAICDREVTRAQFQEFMQAVGLEQFPTDEWSPSLETPMVAPTWYESVLYCRWLTELLGLAESEQCYENPTTLGRENDGFPADWPFHPEKRGFRLPTEAEWEYACRCGTTTTYSFGSDRKLLDRYGWTQSNSGLKTNKSGKLRPNLRGLFDMHGNCWEWCHDAYGPYSTGPVTDPTGLPDGDRRILRGGCWNLNARWSRSACRNPHRPINRNYYIGLRLVLSLEE